MRRFHALWKAAFIAALMFSGTAAYALPAYTLTNLGDYAFAPGWTLASSINDAGQVAGVILTEDYRNLPYLYTPGVGMVSIGAQPPANAAPGWTIDASANGLNNLGQVTGSWKTPGGHSAYIYSAATGMVDIGALAATPPVQYAEGASINDHGTVVGTSFDQALFSYRTFIYDPVNGLRDLGTPPLTNAGGGGVNNAGIIVGTNNETQHATTYDGTTLRDLGTLGGKTSYASDINEAGAVVGYGDVMTPGGSETHAFLYTEAGGMIDLHMLTGLPAGYGSAALSLNDRGQIVGHYWLEPMEQAPALPFLFDATYGFLNLNDLVEPLSAQGWYLEHPAGINDAGQIIGYGLFNGNPAGFLLTPVQDVPEPASGLLVLAALAGLGAMRHKSRSRADA